MDPITLSFSFGISKMHQRWLLKQFAKLEAKQNTTERELQQVKSETASTPPDPYQVNHDPYIHHTPSEKSHYQRPVQFSLKISMPKGTIKIINFCN